MGPVQTQTNTSADETLGRKPSACEPQTLHAWLAEGLSGRPHFPEAFLLPLSYGCYTSQARTPWKRGVQGTRVIPKIHLLSLSKYFP